MTFKSRGGFTITGCGGAQKRVFGPTDAWRIVRWSLLRWLSHWLRADRTTLAPNHQQDGSRQSTRRSRKRFGSRRPLWVAASSTVRPSPANRPRSGSGRRLDSPATVKLLRSKQQPRNGPAKSTSTASHGPETSRRFKTSSTDTGWPSRRSATTKESSTPTSAFRSNQRSCSSPPTAQSRPCSVPSTKDHSQRHSASSPRASRPARHDRHRRLRARNDRRRTPGRLGI